MVLVGYLLLDSAPEIAEIIHLVAHPVVCGYQPVEVLVPKRSSLGKRGCSLGVALLFLSEFLLRLVPWSPALHRSILGIHGNREAPLHDFARRYTVGLLLKRRVVVDRSGDAAASLLRDVRRFVKYDPLTLLAGRCLHRPERCISAPFGVRLSALVRLIRRRGRPSRKPDLSRSARVSCSRVL